jgi:hypothetical protein
MQGIDGRQVSSFVRINQSLVPEQYPEYSHVFFQELMRVLCFSGDFFSILD